MDIDTRQLNTVRNADIDMDTPGATLVGLLHSSLTVEPSWRQWSRGSNSSIGEAPHPASRGILGCAATLRLSDGLLRYSPDGLTVCPHIRGGMLERMVAVLQCSQHSVTCTLRRHSSSGGRLRCRLLRLCTLAPASGPMAPPRHCPFAPPRPAHHGWGPLVGKQTSGVAGIDVVRTPSLQN